MEQLLFYILKMEIKLLFILKGFYIAEVANYIFCVNFLTSKNYFL